MIRLFDDAIRHPALFWSRPLDLRSFSARVLFDALGLRCLPAQLHNHGGGDSAGVGVPALIGCNALGLPNLPLPRFD